MRLSRKKNVKENSGDLPLQVYLSLHTSVDPPTLKSHWSEILCIAIESRPSASGSWDLILEKI